MGSLTYTQPRNNSKKKFIKFCFTTKIGLNIRGGIFNQLIEYRMVERVSEDPKELINYFLVGSRLLYAHK